MSAESHDLVSDFFLLLFFCFPYAGISAPNFIEKAEDLLLIVDILPLQRKF